MNKTFSKELALGNDVGMRSQRSVGTAAKTELIY